MPYLRPHRLFWTGAALLAFAWMCTWGLEAWWVDRVEQHAPAQQADMTQHALSIAEDDFADLTAKLRARAQALASDPAIVQGLQEQRDQDEAAEVLIRHLATLQLPERVAVEVYDPTPRLRAWKGYNMPMDTAPDEVDFLESDQMVVARDGEVRRALVVWWPVRDASGVLGAVRAMHLVRYQPPVQNRYIDDYSLAEVWMRRTGLPIEVRFAGDDTTDLAGRVRLLHDTDRDTLGYVAAQPPSAARLVQLSQARFGDVQAFWATLLMFWLTMGAWLWYRRACRHADQATDRTERHRRLGRAVWQFAVLAGFIWVTRYALLALDVPGRWQTGQAPLAPLFNPTYLASTLGGGLMRSTGDLLITGGFAVVFAVELLDLAARFRIQAKDLSDLQSRMQRRPPERPSAFRFFAAIALLTLAVLGLAFLLARFVQQAVLDSTLDFFSRTGLLPEPLVLAVLCALLLLAVAVLLTAVALLWMHFYLLRRYRPATWPHGTTTLGTVFVSLLLLLLYWMMGVHTVVPLVIVLIFFGGAVGVALSGLVWEHSGVGQLTLRGLLPSIIALTLLLYPMLYDGMDQQRRERMVSAAASFEEGRDPRALFSIDQVLRGAQEAPNDFVVSRPSEIAAVDSAANALLRGSLVVSLATYEASFVIFDTEANDARRYIASGLQAQRAGLDPADRVAFQLLREQYAGYPPLGPMVEQFNSEQIVPGRAPSRFQYAGVVPLRLEGTTTDRYWAFLRVEPRSLLPGTGTAFPRVLLPDGSYSDLYAELSLAEFRDGALARSTGRDFGRALLPADVMQRLQKQDEVWRSASINGREYLTYYRRSMPGELEGTTEPVVVAVRIPAVLAFDHLYYLLRLTVAGLCVGLLLYIFGLLIRYRRGLLPAPRVRFRDKVLNALLVVGVVSMIAAGVIGVQVVTSENSRVIERRLQDDLRRVEETLALRARPGEMIYSVAERTDVDSLAAQVGLDINLYDEGRLVSTSRPRLVRDRLVDDQMPSEAYEALYAEHFRFTTAKAAIGSFSYTIGFQALPDETGQPRYVISVPTLAQQERIEEEQARTLAYLFGALLLLVVVVLMTAMLLANALAQPIAQLRAGLEAVGEGRFARVLPVDSRDEIGELVQTFNEMREQLADSRRKLAQQEREMAWREMARQVAHEIKNPLTPMKLSIQHMRRAFDRLEVPAQTAEGDGAQSEMSKFAEMFKRITNTLVEQIEALARIANEFSTFARMPTRVLEPLDLNEVVRETAALMQAEEGEADIQLNLHPEPLVVEADREEMRRIYINLVKNAVQAIPEDRPGQIEIQTRLVEPDEGPPCVLSTIRDNGTGISPDLRNKIFQPNFSTKTSGTGLGLAITRKSIEELNGHIGFDTQEGEGTTFWIRLPLAEQASPAPAERL